MIEHSIILAGDDSGLIPPTGPNNNPTGWAEVSGSALVTEHLLGDVRFLINGVNIGLRNDGRSILDLCSMLTLLCSELQIHRGAIAESWDGEYRLSALRTDEGLLLAVDGTTTTALTSVDNFHVAVAGLLDLALEKLADAIPGLTDNPLVRKLQRRHCRGLHNIG